MKTNIFYAMNEIDDKYILEAAQCLEHKNTGRNYRLNRDKCLNNKWMTHIVAAILIIVFVFTTGSIINATTHGKIVQWITQLFGAEIVTRENRSLIGKEINDNSVPEVTYSGERCIKQIDKNPIDNSNIIKGVANENIVLPSSISEFEVKNEVTPEIIMTNGSMAVFYVNNYKGWNCKEGDTLTFSFEKYKSETVQKQTFVIGYIRDGIMYEGESMRNIVGSYTLTIKEDGEYNLYIIPIIINDAPMYIRTRSEITFSAFSFPLYIFTAIRKIMANIHHSANMHLRIFFFFTSIFLLSFMINNALFYCQIIRS